MRLRPRSCSGSRVTWSGMSALSWPAPSHPPSTQAHSGQDLTRLYFNKSFSCLERRFLSFQSGAPKRLLKSQEMSLLKDIKDAIDKRVENRIATARRFAVFKRQNIYGRKCLNFFLNRSA